VIASPARDKTICAGVRWGKSQTAAYEVARELMLPNKRIWIVSISYDMAKMVFNHLVDFLGAYDKGMVRKVSFRPPQRLEIKEWSSWVECKSSGEPESLMGQELDLCVVDEAARTPGEIWDRYLAARLSTRQGRSIAISTPFGQNNWFYKRYLQTKETNSSWHFNTLNNPYFKKEEWDRLKSTTPERIFKQEYEAIFLRDAAAVFRGIDSVVADTLKKPERGHYYVMGVDLGKHNDFSVITVIDTITNNVVHHDNFISVEYPLQKARIIATAREYNNARVCIDATHGSVGEPIAEDLTREGLFVEDFGFSGKSKKELIEKLSIFIEQGFIKIPNIEKLIDELNIFGYKLTESGNIVYSAPEGAHDDMVMSLALAVWSLNPGKPRSVDPIARELAKYKKKIIKSYI
jgi:Terminase RNaseH-like domain/Terminase large subunit, T4likevirus-type, N-terminal